ncbi:conserved hypothetical protein (plasmid) [Haloterrigena turkmenica DSM 5511]|uniref:Uncharacterized protein n=1 Tax=Haloterrigena turkmenica (strain ATCC 51198 / DSM 5511 / JCM 9101 / NCIMB 13204 / VKM B-1734 / 4k) TaxID=543526 RepID=D2S3P2_HALTV|nr:hypothetical protein [Haloterrigena turkmenica]ADB63989.1 conserved hypothetical protein [Haloterrigena turkmenica DSM 5511]
MSVRIEGFEELSDRLSQLSRDAESIDGENTVPMTELFPPDFMQTYTEFDSLEEFFDESPWVIESQEDFESIPEKKFDDYVDNHTGFNSWEVMLKAAGREWVGRKLNLD